VNTGFWVLEQRPEGKRSLGRPRCRQEDNIKMNLYKVVREARTGLMWLRIGQMVSSCKCAKKPLGSTKFLNLLRKR